MDVDKPEEEKEEKEDGEKQYKKQWRRGRGVDEKQVRWRRRPRSVRKESRKEESK